MPQKKKKTNFISYELKKLDKYCQQLQAYLDANPPDKMKDRLDVRYSQNGNPIVKTIASKETQLKCWSDRLRELPKLLEDINSLRKAVNEEVPDKDLRGDNEIPGFMLNSDEALSNTDDDEPADDHYREEKFDDEDDIKQLPPSTDDSITDINFTNVESSTDDDEEGWNNFEEEDE